MCSTLRVYTAGQFIPQSVTQRFVCLDFFLIETYEMCMTEATQKTERAHTQRALCFDLFYHLRKQLQITRKAVGFDTSLVTQLK